MGKDTREKCYSSLRQVAMNCSNCIAIFLTKDIPTALSCARSVIVRQRDQKERSGTMKTRQTNPETTNEPGCCVQKLELTRNM